MVRLQAKKWKRAARLLPLKCARASVVPCRFLNGWKVQVTLCQRVIAKVMAETVGHQGFRVAWIVPVSRGSATAQDAAALEVATRQRLEPASSVHHRQGRFKCGSRPQTGACDSMVSDAAPASNARHARHAPLPGPSDLSETESRRQWPVHQRRSGVGAPSDKLIGRHLKAEPALNLLAMRLTA
jgi:hypothetical protein